ncbi:hypothetical protein [Mesorhizobium shangrilense]|uniref:hypothetical protein n=1 Tax=Mesorhizobium shangrilense TaxID=460060 RepID=UPI003F49A381
MRHVGKPRRQLFEEIERAALRPLPAAPFEQCQMEVDQVDPDYHVEVDSALLLGSASADPLHHPDPPHHPVVRRAAALSMATMEAFGAPPAIADGRANGADERRNPPTGELDNGDWPRDPPERAPTLPIKAHGLQ